MKYNELFERKSDSVIPLWCLDFPFESITQFEVKKKTRYNQNGTGSIQMVQRMHVSPAKHSDEQLPRKCDYQTEKWDRARHSADGHTPDKVIPTVCVSMLCRGHKNGDT